MKEQILVILNSNEFKDEWMQLRESLGHDTAFYMLTGKYMTDAQCNYVVENEDIIPALFEW